MVTTFATRAGHDQRNDAGAGKGGQTSRDYDTQYSGAPDVFVESIHRSLATRKP